MVVHGRDGAARIRPTVEVFLAFLKLGLTSFGGPIAHIGYFHDEFVRRRKWLDEAGYGDLVALCQFLPGPASSQVGFSIGVLRAGLPGMETDEPSSFVPVPVERPDPAADPETLANAAGGLDPDAIRKLASRPVPAAEAPVPAEERKIRVVGPTFLPDPQGAIDLRVPAPKTAR